MLKVKVPIIFSAQWVSRYGGIDVIRLISLLRELMHKSF
jgi:hypothetical protein